MFLASARGSTVDVPKREGVVATISSIVETSKVVHLNITVRVTNPVHSWVSAGGKGSSLLLKNLDDLF